MGHIIIISILIVNSLLIKNSFTCQFVRLINSFNLFTRQLLYQSLHEHLLAITDNNTLMTLANCLA